MSKKTISDYLKLKKNAPEKVAMARSMDTIDLPSMDMEESIYEDVTLADILKFQAIMQLLDSEMNPPARSSQYIKM